MPVQHYAGIADAAQSGSQVLGTMLRVAHQVAQEQHLEKGYRLIINEGEHGGKLVPHLHLHVLGGRALGPKMVRE
jgi:histidine triad (HIT) family protein